MDSAQRVNPAPTLYAAAITLIAFASTGGVMLWGDVTTGKIYVLVALSAIVVPAAVAVANVRERLGAMVLSTALLGIAIFVNTAFFSLVGIYAASGSWILGIPFCIAFILFGGASLVGAIATCRRWFSNAIAITIIAAVVLTNALMVASRATWLASEPDQEVEFQMFDRVISLGGGVFYGLAGDLTAALGTTISTIFIVWSFAMIVMFIAFPAAAWCRSIGIDRSVSVAATVISIAGNIALIAYIVFIYIGIISRTKWYEDVDIASAMVAAVVSIFGCMMAPALMGVTVWWYRALRRR